MDYPRIPFSPSSAVRFGDRLLVVGHDDGEMVILDALTLTPISAKAIPFPALLSEYAVLSDGTLVGSWVEHELRVAIMAAIDLNNELADGPTKDELRKSAGSNSGWTVIAGATWSHALDSETLALCSNGNLIAFASYLRGVYCIDKDSNEIWRVGLPQWIEFDDIPEAETIVKMEITEKGELFFWSMGGGWSIISMEDGVTIESGCLDLQIQLERAFHSEGEWLLQASNHELIVWSQGEAKSIGKAKGIIGDATKSDGVWRATGWREDLVISNNEITKLRRNEVGIAMVKIAKTGWLVLDNSGTWSRFGE